MVVTRGPVTRTENNSWVYNGVGVINSGPGPFAMASPFPTEKEQSSSHPLGPFGLAPPQQSFTGSGILIKHLQGDDRGLRSCHYATFKVENGTLFDYLLVSIVFSPHLFLSK